MVDFSARRRFLGLLLHVKRGGRYDVIDIAREMAIIAMGLH